MPKKIPPPPPAPLFPPEELIRSVEEVYVEKRRAKMERETIVAPKEVEKFIKDDLKSFERKDVLTKVYPPNDQVIICEGDSWFNHPLLEDLPELLLYFGYSVLHSNYPGKLLKESLSKKQISWRPSKTSGSRRSKRSCSAAVATISSTGAETEHRSVPFSKTCRLRASRLTSL